MKIWEISTRHLGCCQGLPLQPDFEICRLDGCSWLPSSEEEAFGPSDFGSTQTIIYVHGNWMTRANARSRIQFISDKIACNASQPIRILMLSWPSQRELRPIADIKENAQCTNAQAFYLARILRLLPAEEQISLLGFSFGGRVVTGALHLDAGGSIGGRTLLNQWPDCLPRCVVNPVDPTAGESAVCTRHYRVSLAAPAVDQNSLQACGVHRMAMQCVDRLVNVYNSRDPVLRRFRFLTAADPIAAGFAGFAGTANMGDPPATRPLASQARVLQFDCASSLGRTHDERSFFTKCHTICEAIDNLLWLP